MYSVRNICLYSIKYLFTQLLTNKELVVILTKCLIKNATELDLSLNLNTRVMYLKCLDELIMWHEQTCFQRRKIEISSTNWQNL